MNTNKLLQTAYQPTTSVVKLTDLARDMAIYGEDDLHGVLQAHNVRPEEMLAYMDSPVYKAEFDRVKAQMANPHAAVRIKAQNMLASGVDIIGEIASDYRQPAAARLKAVSMVTELAGVEDKAASQGPSVVLHLDFGGLVQVPAQVAKINEIPQATLAVATAPQDHSSATEWTLED